MDCKLCLGLLNADSYCSYQIKKKSTSEAYK
jgi:hypothetical protein